MSRFDTPRPSLMTIFVTNTFSLPRGFGVMHAVALLTRYVTALHTPRRLIGSRARFCCFRGVVRVRCLQEVLPAALEARQAGDPAAAQLSAQLALLTDPKVQLLRCCMAAD